MMNKNIHIYPHIILLLGGRVLLSLEALVLPLLWFLVIRDFDINNAESISALLLLIIFTILYGVCIFYVFNFLWEPIWGELIVREKDLVYFGLFLKTVIISFEEIKYVEIRTSLESKKNNTKNTAIDAYKFILISNNPLPKNRIDKIKTSKKAKLIKYAVSKKLCEALIDRLPQKNKWVIERQLSLYNNFNQKPKRL